jgi:hypothetical protein
MIGVLEIALGIFMLVFASWRDITFYQGRLGATVRQDRKRPIQPQWAARLLLIVIGLAALVDGIWKKFYR